MEHLEGPINDYEATNSSKQIIYNFKKEFYYDLLIVMIYKLIFKRRFQLVLLIIYCTCLALFIPTVILDKHFKFFVPFLVDGFAFFVKVFFIKFDEDCIEYNTFCLKLAKLSLISCFPFVMFFIVFIPTYNIVTLGYSTLLQDILAVSLSLFGGIIYSFTYLDLSLYFLLIMKTIKDINKEKINKFNYENTFFFFTNFINVALFSFMSYYYYKDPDGGYFQLIGTICYIFILILPIYEVNTYIFKYKKFDIEDVFKPPYLMILYVPITSTTLSYVLVAIVSFVMYLAF